MGSSDEDDGRQGAERGPLVAHALRLEYLTVGWNVIEGIEGIVAVGAALAARS
jgi:hypothetical protein